MAKLPGCSLMQKSEVIILFKGIKYLIYHIYTSRDKRFYQIMCRICTSIHTSATHVVWRLLTCLN